MNIATWLQNTTSILRSSSETPQLDSEVILQFVLNKDRAWIHTYPDYLLSQSELAELSGLVKRRVKHEPVAYLLGKQEFYGYEFYVTPDVLVPRPESEFIIELLLGRIKHVGNGSTKDVCDVTLLDIGTGSGALAITAALELSHLPFTIPLPLIYAIDIDKKCLPVARKNAKQLKAEVTFLQGNLLTPALPHLPSTIPQPLFILANLPYVPDTYSVNIAASYEPKHALYGGSDGLELYKILFAQLAELAKSRSAKSLIYCYTESLLSQHEALHKIAKNYGFELLRTEGLVQEFGNVC